jgi:lysophospholipase L1-like esterase
MNKWLRLWWALAPVLLLAACGADNSSKAEDSAPTPSGPPSWHLVGLGDSFTATQNSSGRSYLDLFGKSLQAKMGRTVQLEDLSSDDSSTTKLADELRHDQTIRDTVAAADIILVSVGGNDSDPFGVYPRGTCSPKQPLSACLHAYAPDFAKNYDVILSEIESLRAGKPTAIRVTSADNPFVGWSEAPSKSFGVQFYRQVAEAETKAACAAAARHGGMCVDYLHIFGGAHGTADPAPFLGQDHAHPGDVGIKAIADLLAQIGVPELSS